MITKFIEALLQDKNPIIYGNGRQTRDFIYVEDVAEALTLALEKNNIEGEVINIATGQPATINKLLAIIAKAMNKNTKSSTRITKTRRHKTQLRRHNKSI